MDTILYLLACYGLTFTVCDAHLFGRPRRWLKARSSFIHDLLSCHFCTGFWTSMAIAAVLYSSQHGSLISKAGWSIVYGFAGAAFCYAFDTVVRWFEPPGSDLNA